MSAETTNSFLTWAPPEIDRTVHMDYGVVERLNIEVMRGFGVTRRRGTETGGILLGRIDRRVKPMVVHIHDFEVVPCEFAYGPSYELSPNDTARFREGVARWQPSLENESYAVGYFRSHTREGFALNEKDAALFHDFFRDPCDVALLVKPFATRAATAGFFLQDQGALVTSSSPLEFPLMAPGPSEEPRRPEPPQPPSVSRSSQAPAANRTPAQLEPVRTEQFTPVPNDSDDDRTLFATHHAAPSRWPGRLAWTLLGFALLAFGAACGYEFAATKLKQREVQQAATVAQQPGAALPKADQYALGLQVQESNGAVVVKWDRNAAPIQAALHGLLTVTTNTGSKEVRLSFAELRNGMAMYPHTAPQLRFRFEIFFRDNRSLIETAAFRPNPASTP